MLVVHLYVSYAHVNLCHVFSSSWCKEVTATSAGGSFRTFLFTFFIKKLPIQLTVALYFIIRRRCYSVDNIVS